VSYLSRYLAGEYQQVWQEITHLPDNESPANDADVLAVITEMMRRVRQNVECLRDRLQDLGYRFGYAWMQPVIASEREQIASYTPEFLREAGIPEEVWEDMRIPNTLPWIEQQGPVVSTPLPDISARCTLVAEHHGPIPLVLQSFYRVVGGVNFVGTPPDRWIPWNHPEVTVSRTYTEQVRSGASLLDPLSIAPLADRWLRYALRWGEVFIGEDRFFKYYYSGGGAYKMPLTSPMMIDAPLSGYSSSMLFVEFLRWAFSWGGFPGYAVLPNYPGEELQALTAGLLPF
jgi:hypothetical protein